MIGRANRFHGLGSLNFAYKTGQTARGPLLSLKFVRNPRRNTYRVAVVVSRKVHKSAVTRNRIRRRVYEALRAYSAQISGPYDLVFTVFNDQITTIEFTELEKQVKNLLTRADVLTSTNPRAHDIVNTEGKQV